MKIQINRIGFEDFHTEIFHILKLFFEEVEVHYDVQVDADLLLDLQVASSDSNVHVAGQLHDRGSEQTWKREYQRKLDISAAGGVIGISSENDRKRTVKRAVGYVMLQLLQEATGIEQPWGILTGVRPTKLMHNLMTKHSRAECMQMLREEYLVTEPKVQLLTEIAERQLEVIPDLFHLDKAVSIYVGIPFCPTKCAYCTFPAYDIRGSNGSVNTFLQGLHYEIQQTGKWLKDAGLKITTIYWGGGTPTSIEAHEMDALFATMHESFPAMDQVRELTVEAGRPDTITVEKINVMKKWNVDRISINPQSFTQSTLETIGRDHTVDETIEKFKLCRQMGLDNINMDLIIGLPNEGMEEFQRTLEETEKLLPESLTVHTLSFKRASKMTKNRDQYEVAERHEIARMMRMAGKWTIDHGYHPYYMYRQKNILGNLENVGYSLEGRDSLYNIVMMEERQTIIGLGCGAVSKVIFPKDADVQTGEQQRIERFPNPKEPSVYNKAYKEYLDKKLNLLDEAYGIRVHH